MQSHTLLTTSGRGSGSEPTTAASSLDGCSGFIRAGLTFLPDEPLPALASLPDVPSAGLALLPEVLFAAGALAFLSGAFLAVSAFLGGVGCLALLGIVDLLPMVQTVVGGRACQDWHTCSPDLTLGHEHQGTTSVRSGPPQNT